MKKPPEHGRGSHELSPVGEEVGGGAGAREAGPPPKVAKRKVDRTLSAAAAATPELPVIDLTKAANLDLKAGSELVEAFEIPPEIDLTGIQIPVLTPQVGVDVPGSPPEPVYPPKVRDDIQGNIIPGFNKPHQHFLFFRVGPVRGARTFLKWIAPHITSMEEVLAFRKLYRSRRLRLGRGKFDLHSTWVNIGFSYNAIRRLESVAAADQFGDRSFRQGLAERSGYLGDPKSPSSRGHASRWKVGGPENEADIVIIVASDITPLLDARVEEIRAQARAADMELLFSQRGGVLPGRLRGHEHFGFRDGISQPGVRGKLSTAGGDYITPRYIDHSDPRRLYFAKPGQILLWPGQFLLGEERQSTEDFLNSVPAATNFPAWARHGSYLVVRRLNQDVRAFWTFVKAASVKTGIPPGRFAAMLVGRWPSGAPLLRSPAADDPALGGDEFANNHFIFDDDTRPSSLRPIPGYGGDGYPQASADFLARVCPHFAHIRKVNPRDTATELGKPEDSPVHMILRRGIPFGRPLFGIRRPPTKLLREERGLMFLCYGSTIEDQFEFLQRRWANSPAQPNLGGYDPVIGQNGTSRGRARFIDVPTGSGSVRVKIKNEWVTPTGGGYFFAPPISAIYGVLAR